MEQICEPGCVYLTEHTARLVDGYFELRDLGETRVKSVTRPIRVHELVGVGALRTRFDLSRARGLSRFVGRQTEMQTLEQALAEARAGRGQVVGVADRRRPLQAAAARALVDTVGRKVDENAALIGRQWEGAEEWLEAARWYAQAAKWTMRGDVFGAMRHCRTAHALIGRVPESEESQRIELQTCSQIFDLGFRVGLEPYEEERLFERSMILAQQLGDRDAAAVIRSSHSAVRRWLSGQRGGDAALDVAGATDPESVSRVVATTAWTAILYGTLPEAVAASAAAMELIERRPELLWTTYASAAIGIRARALAYNGRVDEAEELSLRVLEAARATGQVELEGWANGWRANTLLARGHVQEALRHARRDLEIAETLGSPMSRVTARWICGDVGSVLGLWAETEHWGQEGIDILRMHHVAVELEASFLTFWAEGLAGRGESARAQELIAEAIAKTESLGSRFLGFRAHLGNLCTGPANR